MNSTELLDQFIAEARECLETIGRLLLEVERRPRDADLLNGLFRAVHTLKGNCGLFEFKPLEQVVHACEDLLDRVRDGSAGYTNALADALLEAMDFSVEMVDQIERTGGIDPSGSGRSAPLAAALRALLPGAAPAAARSAPDDDGDLGTRGDPLPLPVGTGPDRAWRVRLRGWAPAASALRYVPEPDCFFKGEDPWRLVCTTPGLQQVAVEPGAAWPQGEALDAWDCYRCNLDFVLTSSASRAELEAHFRCVPEQVDFADGGVDAGPAPVPSPTDASIARRAAQLWADQVALLAVAGIAPGTLQATERALRALLAVAPQWRDTRVAMAAALADLPRPLDARSLLGWARSVAGLPAAQAVPPAGDADRREPEPPAAAAGASPEDGGDRQQRVLKVSQDKIDRLMELIGEMVVAKNSLPYLGQRAEEVFGQRELSREIKAQYAVINRIAEDMQHAIMQVRMLPVGTVFQRFGRLVRDISRKLGKEVRLEISGEETEADKNVIEPLADPLIHILRNSLDHGIEMPEVRARSGKPACGTIRIAASQQSDRVVIEIGDDGAGIDPKRVRDKAVERGLIPADRASTLSDEEAVQLIFLPGFSTAERISDLSGRGVGMDVVRTAIERINGSVELHSVLGQGTTIRLSLPLSMAVTNVMLVESAGRRFGVPMDLIDETVRVNVEDIHQFKSARTAVLRGRIVPLRPLNELLGIDEPARLNADGEHAVLVVRLASGPVGLIVDQFDGVSDIILKPLEGVLAGLTGFAGTALIGDGSVLMVLNPKELS